MNTFEKFNGSTSHSCDSVNLVHCIANFSFVLGKG